jgi:hypothetical protein
MLSGQFKDGDTVRIEAQDREVVLKPERSAAEPENPEQAEALPTL